MQHFICFYSLIDNLLIEHRLRPFTAHRLASFSFSLIFIVMDRITLTTSKNIPNDENNCSPQVFFAFSYDSTFHALTRSTCKNRVKTAKQECAANFVAKVNFFAQFSEKMGQTCNTESLSWSNDQIHQRSSFQHFKPTSEMFWKFV